LLHRLPRERGDAVLRAIEELQLARRTRSAKQHDRRESRGRQQRPDFLPAEAAAESQHGAQSAGHPTAARRRGQQLDDDGRPHIAGPATPSRTAHARLRRGPEWRTGLQPGVGGGGGGGGMAMPHANNHGSAPMPAPMAGGSPTLFLIYNGQRYPVTKDQFIIGRGSKTSDLPIKDGNISRKHAAVIRRNGTFYIKDLGSTNGIDYKGMRIDNKRIDEGDVFHLCDYELRFTYRAD
jgi:hypothetical protein